jgi:phage-related protein
MKPVSWLASSLADTRLLGEETRREIGYQLFRVQSGLEPSDWRPMPAVGTGVNEIRIHCEGEHRVLYLARLADAVYVLHVFEKKTQKTNKRDIDLASARLRALLQSRKAPK